MIAIKIYYYFERGSERRAEQQANKKDQAKRQAQKQNQKLKNRISNDDFSFNFKKLLILLSSSMQARNIEELSKYTLPSGVATSGQQLKNLQQKLLQNYYQTKTQLNKYPYQSTSTLANSGQTATRPMINYERSQNEKDRFLNEYDNQTRMAEKKMKHGLANDLVEQMELKTIKRQMDKRSDVQVENQLTKNMSGVDSLERQKEKQFTQKYKEEAKEDLQMKKKRKVQEYVDSAHEKEFYRNHYSQGEMQQSHSLGNLTKQSSYINPTKQYYYEIDQAMRQRDNPERNARSNSFKVTHSSQKMKNLENMYNDSLKNHVSKQQNIFQQMKERQMRQKEDLRHALLSQMKQKTQAKRQNRIYEVEVPYSSPMYRSIHHPINNPVDFKYAHDNQYVIGELKSIQ